MNATEITINGQALASMGVTLLNGSYANLLLPASLKDFVENDDPRKHGTQVITHDSKGDPVAVIKERDVTLTFAIRGSDRASFLANYAAFVGMLHQGSVTLYVPDLERYFHLIYSSSTQYDNYRMTACTMSVKFREPNPANRSMDSL